jgi:hypothetical protein
MPLNRDTEPREFTWADAAGFLTVAAMNRMQTFEALLTTPEPADLGPGPRAGVLPPAEIDQRLAAAFREIALPTTVQQLVRGLLLLWHDHLDLAHTVAQRIENRDGSLIHAIMHRREPDYWNSKYWWRRVGQHPCFAVLSPRVATLLELRAEGELLANVVPGGRWDAFAFVDACEAAARLERNAEQLPLLREVQRFEFETALAHFLGDQAD